MEDTMIKANESQTQLLCCRYLLVHFEALPVQVQELGAACERKLLWALGVLSDGQYESLGVWPETEEKASVWRAVFDDLKIRGVEEIRFVLSPELPAIRPALDQAYPSAKLLPSPSFHHRRAVMAGEDVVRELQRRTRYSLRRHGCFVNLRDATAFATQALGRAERTVTSAPARADGFVKRLVDAASRASNDSRAKTLGL